MKDVLCAYAMVTEPVDGGCFVKFGITNELSRRVKQIQSSCPINIMRVMYVGCSSQQAQERLEAALHMEHLGQSVGGEWFKIPGSHAVEEVNEAMLYIGQRELGRAVVEDLALPARNNPRARILGRYRKRELRSYVIGDVDPSSVEIRVKRKITVDRKA